MKIHRLTRSALLVFALSFFAGSSFAAKSGAEQMREFEYNQMKLDVANYQIPLQPAPGKALVYVIRPSNGGGTVRFNVFVDSKDDASEVGFTRGGQYIYFSLTPGSHKIYSKAENWAEIQISANAGDVIFIKQDPNLGMFMASNSLSIADEVEGKYRVKRLGKGEILKADGVVASNAPQQPQPVTPVVPSPQGSIQQQTLVEPTSASATTPPTTAQKLRELQSLWKDGLITDEEYKAKKSQLLEKL